MTLEYERIAIVLHYIYTTDSLVQLTLWFTDLHTFNVLPYRTLVTTNHITVVVCESTDTAGNIVPVVFILCHVCHVLISLSVRPSSKNGPGRHVARQMES